MNSRTCLVGYSGFVGSNLLDQTRFDDIYRSTNINEISGKSYSLVVCAGVPAVKWYANKHPEEDRNNIERLFRFLSTVSVERLVLISTVDVYPVSTLVDESFDCGSLPNHAYGTHRLELESQLTAHFPSIHIVRLPGLIGAGLKKNVLYDLLHDNCLEAINPSSVFQYYDLSGLWRDLQTVLEADLPLVNLATEPIATKTVIEQFFSNKKVGSAAAAAARYDVRTQHAKAFGKSGPYRFDAGEVLGQMKRYFKSADITNTL